jgi:hypothetical protein
MTKPAYSRHHRKPRSIGGTDEERNISNLPIRKHRAWHILFENMTAFEIANEINVRYLDPDWILIPRRRS